MSRPVRLAIIALAAIAVGALPVLALSHRFAGASPDGGARKLPKLFIGRSLPTL
jgi:hypothetical protein